MSEINQTRCKEEAILVRQNKYLNKLIEQDHRTIKRRVRPMLEFKSFWRASVVLAGIELTAHVEKKAIPLSRSGKPIFIPRRAVLSIVYLKNRQNVSY